MMRVGNHLRAGPVSSLSFFERSIQYAINQGVPKDKIVAGLPFYGRMWKLDGPTLEGKTLLEWEYQVLGSNHL